MDKSYYGKLLYNQKKYNFSFKDNIIVLQPEEMSPTWEDIRNMFKRTNFKSNNSTILEGETTNGFYICFLNIKLINNGRGSYKAYVPAYIIGTTNNLNPLPKVEQIYEMKFEGEAIDLLYNPQKLIKENTLLEEKRAIVMYKVNENTTNIECKDRTVKYEIGWNFSCKERNTPLNLRSIMRVEFKEKKELSNILDEYLSVERMFKFIYNRAFVPFKEITLINKVLVEGFLDEDKTEEHNAEFKLFITVPVKREHDLPRDESKLELDNLKSKYENLYAIVNEENHYYMYYPDNSDDDSYINVDKFIQISSAFESEFDKLYPDYKSSTNPLYKEAKNLVLEDILTKMLSSSGKKKKYFQKFYDSINNLEGLLEEQLRQTFKDFDECIRKQKKELIEIYEIDKITDEELIIAFSNKRNALAHGKVETGYNDIEIIAFLIVKILVRCITLKRAGYEIQEITNIIEKSH